MIPTSDLLSILAEQTALDPGHPMRNERVLAMAREILASRPVVEAAAGSYGSQRGGGFGAPSPTNAMLELADAIDEYRRATSGNADPKPTEFYILSLKWTRSGEECVTWWGPKNSGYVLALEEAGRYSAETVAAAPSYYDNRESTLAVPCEVVGKFARRYLHVDAVGSLVTEAIGRKAHVLAPFVPSLDDDGKPYECSECEQRPTHKGPSKIVLLGDAP